MKIPFSYLIFGTIGFLFFYYMGQIAFAFIILSIASLPVLNALNYNSELGEYLILALNSGDKTYFECEKKQFLKESFTKIENVLKTGGEITVNFKECTFGDTVGGDKIINQGNITNVAGTGNITNVKNSDSMNVKPDTDLKILNNFFITFREKYEEDTSERFVCDRIYAICNENNSSKLKEFIKKNAVIVQNIIGNISSQAIINILKKYL